MKGLLKAHHLGMTDERNSLVAVRNVLQSKEKALIVAVSKHLHQDLDMLERQSLLSKCC